MQVVPGIDRHADLGGSARLEFTRRLSALHRAAGAPSLRNVAMLAQQRVRHASGERRPARASAQRISDWLNGRNVPARFESLLPVLQVLGARARRRAGTPSDTVNLRAWRSLWEAARAAPAEAATPRTSSPYPAGGAYSGEHEAVFYGRRRALTALLGMVRMSASPQRPADMIVLTGASGVGKTALLRAGLLPALGAEGGQWSVAYITPGRDPLRALTRAFGGDLEAAQRRSGKRRLLLIVDQFEELYDPDVSPVARESFLIRLKRLAGAGTVLISVRSDALIGCTRYSWLLNAVQHNSFTLSPMLRQEMASVITGPLRAQGVSIDPGVTELVLTALEAGRRRPDRPAADPGNLPLLFATMQELWSAHTADRVDLGTYRRIGGVAEVTCALAEQVWASLSPSERVDARQLLLTLITVHRDGVLPRRAPITELRRIADRSASGHALLERLVQARLISLESRHASLIHDALLRWDRLRGWIADNRPMLLWRQRIEEDAAEWDSAGRDLGLLYRSIRLTTAINHADPTLSPTATNFLRASARLELGTAEDPPALDFENVG
ncbi:ATP-binding protein [Nocardia sp. NEAU-G5]|uniref:ATP-binding protein n=1 Tax=Nocardia albiluteola TaxID=2842303 RepID=A0ABS6ATB2_9NOCA|nr:ATP-binding protein [Nocardia albiluteola]MBU3061272.1 ATP-binding protein [Nocardia albiluteola]